MSGRVRAEGGARQRPHSDEPRERERVLAGEGRGALGRNGHAEHADDSEQRFLQVLRRSGRRAISSERGSWRPQSSVLLAGLGSVLKRAATQPAIIESEPPLPGEGAGGAGQVVAGDAPDGFVRYRCSANDTFASIALRFNMRLTHLTQTNHVTSPHPYSGEILFVRRPKVRGLTPKRTHSSNSEEWMHEWSGEVLRFEAYLHKEPEVLVEGQISLSTHTLAFNPSPSHALVRDHSPKPYRLHLSVRLIEKSVLEDGARLCITYRRSLVAADAGDVGTCTFSMVGENAEEHLLRLHTRLHVLMMLFHQDQRHDASHPMMQRGWSSRRNIDPDAFLPALDTPSQILADTHVQELSQALPFAHRFENWYLLYSLYHHGISLTTFFRHTFEMGPSLIVIKDENDHVFGGFASESWQQSGKYYGTGESFVFQLEPNWKVYRWTGANEYFIISSMDSVNMGGGGHFAFSLDNDFLQGTSGPCATFGSPCLAANPDFRCMALEVWGFAKPDLAMTGASCV